MRSRLAWLSFVLAIGCGDDVTSSDEGASTGGSTSTSPSTSGPDPSTTTGSAGTSEGTSSEGTTSADDSSSGEGFEPPQPECGNGFVEDGEECDDANDDDADGCTQACQLRCGLDWTALSLPPTDTSDMDAVGVSVDDRGGATMVGFLREITTDQRGNETILDDEGVVVRITPDGETAWEVRLAQGDADVNVRGVAEDGMGNAYVAADVAINGEDADIRLYKLDGDGAVVWTADFDSAIDNAEDLATGVAIGADGNPVVSGQVRVGPGDDDVWVGSFDAESGAELWTQTWSGEFSGMFSTDDGGPIAVGPEGTVYVFAREYVDFQTNVATLLAFDGGGGEATVLFSTDFGVGAQNQIPADVSVDEDGAVHVTYTRVLASQNEHYLVRLDPADGSELWSLEAAEVEASAALDSAEDFVIVGADPLPGGGLAVTGTLVRSGDDAEWNETWLARYGSDDTLDCIFVRESPQLSFIPGSLISRAVSAGPSGRAVVSAAQFEDGVQSLWIGAFRPD